MTQAKTTIRKGGRGWTGETMLPLGFAPEGKPAFLQVSTHGGGGKITTYASVVLRDGHFTTTRVFRDFHECLENARGRGTEKTVRDLHAAHVANLEAIKARALAFHEAKGDLAPTPQAEAA